MGKLEVSFQAAFRVKYAVCFALAAVAFVAPEQLSGSPYFPFPAHLSGADADICAVFTAMWCAVLGCVCAACAQLESVYAQKKVTQYMMVMPVAEIFVAATKSMGNVYPESKVNGAIVLAVLDLLWGAAVCYLLNAKPKKTASSTKAEPKMLCLTRCLYAFLFLTSAFAIVLPQMWVGIIFRTTGAASEAAIAALNCNVLGVSAALMAVAQCDTASMKKVLQYLMVVPFGSLMLSIPMHVPHLLALGAEGVQFMYVWMVFSWVWLSLTILVVYPCSYRTWVLRGSYLFYFFAGWMHIMYPGIVGAVFMYSSDPSATAYQTGCILMQLSFLMMAAAQSDLGFTQSKVVEYSILGDVALVAMACMGKDFSLVLAGCTAKVALAKAYDRYLEKYGGEAILTGKLWTVGSYKMKSSPIKKK